jgi:hypothetical protein
MPAVGEAVAVDREQLATGVAASFGLSPLAFFGAALGFEAGRRSAPLRGYFFFFFFLSWSWAESVACWPSDEETVSSAV